MEVLKRENPLIHMITNYVTVNDLAQVTINYGGLPLMATHHDELKEITKMAKGKRNSLCFRSSRCTSIKT